MNNETANKILTETEAGYDLISKKFSETRKHFWRGLEFIRDYTHENDNVLDYGCGNGRLLELLNSKNINYWGLDVSEKLVEIAKNKYQVVEVTESDSDSESDSVGPCFAKINPSQTSLPSEDGFFNTIYSIAVFHHFPSKKYRQDVAKELYRTMKDGGYIVVTVWYLWPAFSASWWIRRGKQKKYFKNILHNWLSKLKGKSVLDWNDCYISFTNNEGEKIQRFHRAFTKRELKKLFENAGFRMEKCEVIDGRNILFVGKKCAFFKPLDALQE